MNHVMPLPNATTLEEYVVTRLLGQGGFGTTYLCVDRNLDRRCVIKEYSPHHLAERRKNGELKAKAQRFQAAFEKGLKGFLDEARTLARFNHPNIVRINRYFRANGTGYFVMDYESGISLRSLLSQEGSQL